MLFVKSDRSNQLYMWLSSVIELANRPSPNYATNGTTKQRNETKIKCKSVFVISDLTIAILEVFRIF
jgi:hypothetical protein